MFSGNGVAGLRHLSLGRGRKPKHNGTHRYRFYANRRKPEKCFTKSGSFDMIEIIKPELIAHRNALRRLGLTVAIGVATSVGVMMLASTASAGEASGHVRRASCTVVRYYVAKYSAPVAEAYARSKGATDADIQTARRCISPQQTAQVGYTDRAF
jgi:hypothetical protein